MTRKSPIQLFFLTLTFSDISDLSKKFTTIYQFIIPQYRVLAQWEQRLNCFYRGSWERDEAWWWQAQAGMFILCGSLNANTLISIDKPLECCGRHLLAVKYSAVSTCHLSDPIVLFSSTRQKPPAHGFLAFCQKKIFNWSTLTGLSCCGNCVTSPRGNNASSRTRVCQMIRRMSNWQNLPCLTLATLGLASG